MGTANDVLGSAAKNALASKGAKLHTAEMLIKRTASPGKYIVEHRMADKHGNPPQDGQKSVVTHVASSPAELQKHVATHMDPAAGPQQAAVPSSAPEEPNT
jgi:hypothetical protein